MLNRLRDARDNEQGFTLVELLVVIIIIGILAAIAIPVFLNQRQKANDAAVESDVKNVATNIETALVEDPNADDISTAADQTGTATVTVGTAEASVPLTDGVTVSVEGDNSGYVIEGFHANGDQYKSGSPLVYNSAAGGFTDAPADGE